MTRLNRCAHVSLAIALFVGVSSMLDAQTLDRSKRPQTQPTAPYVFPSVQSRTLPNGLTVQIVENHALPLVAVRAVIQGGTLLDPPGKTGLFTLDTLLLRDGTTTMTGPQLTEAIDELGAAVFPTKFTTVTEQFERALSLMGDMLMHPSYTAAALDRRKSILTSNLQRDEGVSATPALRIFNNLVYGADHPLARTATAATFASITRDDVVQLHDAYVRPQNVTLIIAGDVSAASVMPIVTRIFGGWERKGTTEAITAALPATAPAKPTTIYLYDRPKSTQSTIFLGQAGPQRSAADFYALETLGALLGGATGSRITQSLREKRPLTYGVRYAPVWRRAGDPSVILGSANVDAVKTDTALVVWMGELRDVANSRPPTADELTFARSVTAGQLATRIETIDAVADRLAIAARDRMPVTYYTDYVTAINRVTAADLTAAAKRYIDASHTIVVIVGDRSVIEAPLRAAGIGPIVVVDENGRPIQ